jgi:hypothetical protein
MYRARSKHAARPAASFGCGVGGEGVASIPGSRDHREETQDIVRGSDHSAFLWSANTHLWRDFGCVCPTRGPGADGEWT